MNAEPMGAVGRSTGRVLRLASTIAIGFVPKGATLMTPIGVTLMSYVTFVSGAFSVRYVSQLSRRTQPMFLSLRSEEHTSELQSRSDLVCRLLLEKKKKKIKILHRTK